MWNQILIEQVEACKWSFLIACFYWKFRKTWYLLKKTYCNESQKLSSQQVFFFRFNFVSPLQFLHCYYNEYPVKQTATFYIKFPLKPTFFSVFCLFWKDKSLYLLNNYFRLNYLWISRPNSFMEGDEGGMFSKAPDWKPLFLLKIKIKQNPGCPNK